MKLQTNAVRRGDDLIINGQKIWITNGIKADWALLLANTSEGPPHKNKSLICVPLNLPGCAGLEMKDQVTKLNLKKKFAIFRCYSSKNSENWT